MTALLDTGFLFAILDEDDQMHESCRDALLAEQNVLLPDVVIPELAYLILRDLGYAVLVEFLNSIILGELEIVQTTNKDLARSNEILLKYADSKIDFVDCVIMAMAERLKIDRILTVDLRHFRMFRPAHCPAFKLLP